MAKAIWYLLELLGIGGLVGLLAYITWTKMALGSALSLLGAFFPELHAKESEQGEGTIDAGKVKVVFRGGLRFVVVISGLVLIVGAVLDGHEKYKEEKARDEISRLNNYDSILTDFEKSSDTNGKVRDEEIRAIIMYIINQNERRERELKKVIKDEPNKTIQPTTAPLRSAVSEDG